MTTVYDECFEYVLGHEGGFQDMYHDRGNWTTGIIGRGLLKGTKFGITAMAYPHLDIRNLTVEQAKEIYFPDYWQKTGCDTMPAALALATFDFAVNSGVKRAADFLARSKSWRDLCDKRLAWLRTLGNFDRFGAGWTTRVKALKKQCEALEKKYGTGTAVNGLPAASLKRLDVERVFLNGVEQKGEVTASVVGNKLYVNVKE